jgi:hypothetical protein
MTDFVDFLFGSGDLLPRGACLAWQPGLVWLRATADAISALAGVGLAAAAAVFLSRRSDMARVARGLGYLLIGFLIAGYLTHLASLVTLWVPAYGVQGIVKASTAAISLCAAVVVWPRLPKLVALPSPRDLQRANAALGQTNASLETTIAWRTYELEQANERFEHALAGSSITVFAQDSDLQYTWIHNPRPGLTPDTPDGDIDQSANARATELKRQVLASGQSASGMISIAGGEGTLYFDLTVNPTRDRSGAVDGVLCAAVDVTEKRQVDVRFAAMAAQVASAYRRFELALMNSPITDFEQDADLRYTFMHNPPPGTAAADFLDRTDADIFPEVDQR